MKVNREQAAQNRERVLDTAAQLYRENGFHGIGVADLMKSAGLTHGGFYGQFSSKEELMEQACARAFARSVDYWQATIDAEDQGPHQAIAAIAKAYLSATHRDAPGKGCALAALGAEAARQGPKVRRTFTAGLQALASTLAPLLPGKSKAARHEEALATYASFVGALVLSRAVDDDKLSASILRAVATRTIAKVS
ncbi:MAG TPA: TetR/AcrR family transcriptional regulator [Steroidobacteraceae bacterium]|nr:TetR/AcrR family transcriptional regulator [Steroidobacteraceae bacterium]